MFSLYKRLSLRSRLLIFVLAETVITAIAYRYHYPFPLVPLVAGGVLVAIDVVLRRTNLVAAAIVGLIQLVASTYLATSTGLALGAADPTGIAFYFLQTFLLFALGLQVAFSLYTARGRLWVNLMLSSLLLDFSYLTLQAIVASATISLIARIMGTAFAALGFTLIYFLFRSLNFRKHEAFTMAERPQDVTGKSADYFEKHGFTVINTSYPHLDFIAYRGQEAYGVYTLNVRDKMAIQNNELVVDGKEVTPVLDAVVTSTRRWARKHRLGVERVNPVLFTHKSGLHPDLRRITVRSRRSPDRVLGRIYVVNHAGGEKLIRSLKNDRGVGKRGAKRLAALPA